MPRVESARFALWLVLAALASGPLGAPPAPGSVRLAADGVGCRLVAHEGAAACDCAALSGRQRLLLGQPLPLNRAQASDLEALPGLGPVRAEAIVAERARGGPFASHEALARVRGVGPATVARLRPLLSVDERDPACAGERELLLGPRP